MTELESVYLKILDAYSLVSGEEMRAEIRCLPILVERQNGQPVRQAVPAKGERAERWDLAIGNFGGSGPTILEAAKTLLAELGEAAKRMREYHKKAYETISKELGITDGLEVIDRKAELLMQKAQHEARAQAIEEELKRSLG